MTIGGKPTYSICITNYDSFHSIRPSIESLFSQIDDRFEIVVVDNLSNDGSLDILRHYERLGKIRLIARLCSRGLGRQIGIQYSEGKYIITQADTDDIFEQSLNELLRIYHRDFEGSLLLVQGVPGIVIAPRELVNKVGGYRDLNWLEDKDLYSRVANVGRFRFLKSFRIVSKTVLHPGRSQRLRTRIQKQYYYCREAFRLGDIAYSLKTLDDLRKKNPLLTMVFPGLVLILIAAFATHWFYPRFHNEFIRSFNAANYILVCGER